MPTHRLVPCADVRPLGYPDGLIFCRELAARGGVVAVPVGVFVDDPGSWRHLVLGRSRAVTGSGSLRATATDIGESRHSV